MRIKITYDPNTLTVVEFSCVPVAKASKKKLQANQVYVDGALVPVSFYRRYNEFSLVDGKLMWDPQSYKQ